ncbi:MAG: TIGR02452 family protein [Rhodopirellula sp.]|nr:TIGR02452 family protein [Rhodopirellula sp.]
MANREQRAGIAAETVAITQAGSYEAPSGRTVSIRDAVQAAVEASTLFAPGDTLRTQADEVLSGRSLKTVFEVRNETTFAAVRRLIGPTAVLNFASAKNPGGGFLSGSQAQEESLARARSTPVSNAIPSTTRRTVTFSRRCTRTT